MGVHWHARSDADRARAPVRGGRAPHLPAGRRPTRDRRRARRARGALHARRGGARRARVPRTRRDRWPHPRLAVGGRTARRRVRSAIPGSAARSRSGSTTCARRPSRRARSPTRSCASPRARPTRRWVATSRPANNGMGEPRRAGGRSASRVIQFLERPCSSPSGSQRGMA